MTDHPEDRARWKEVAKRSPCPICGHSSWCTVAPSGTLACCHREGRGAVSHNKDKGYWIHKLDGDKRLPPAAPRKPEPQTIPVDFPRLAKRAEELLTHTALVIHAERLGLTPWTLRALRCGDYGGALGFPMVDARGEVIGVRLRTIDGKKICVKGSHNGLFIVREQEYCPWADPGHSALFIVEGGTNLAALCQIGLWGIGRPSCSCGVEMLCEYLSDYRGEIVVLRDNETKPAALAYSIPGAITLANALARHHKVRLATTPTKDLRDWVIAGATALAVLGLARNTMQWDAQTKG